MKRRSVSILVPRCSQCLEAIPPGVRGRCTYCQRQLCPEHLAAHHVLAPPFPRAVCPELVARRDQWQLIEGGKSSSQTFGGINHG